MTKEVVFPEFIGESDEALVLVLPTLKEDLSDLFAKFHAGEEVNYSFSWELLEVDDDDFLVLLDIDWEEGIGVGIGFSPEMWEIFRTVTSKQHIVLMCDWEVVTMGVTGKTPEEVFKPHALLIRDANRGLWKLLDQAEELEPTEDQKEIVEYLYDVLGEVHTQKFLLN